MSGIDAADAAARSDQRIVLGHGSKLAALALRAFAAVLALVVVGIKRVAERQEQPRRLFSSR